jgi:glucokinase
MLDRIAGEFAQLISEARIDRHSLVGFGVVVPGVVDPAQGIVVDSPAFGWRNVNLAQELADRLQLPVTLESILNATNIAETEAGRCRGMSNVVLVRVSLNIGMSTIAGGRLIRGAAGAAGRVAHVPVGPASRACACGQSGCLEMVASGRAILLDLGLRTHRGSAVDRVEEEAEALRAVIARIDGRDATARRAVVRAGRRMGELLATVASILDPEAFVLSGPIGGLAPYVAGARESIESILRARGAALPRIVTSTTDGQIAAVRLALSEFVFSSRGSSRLRQPAG